MHSYEQIAAGLRPETGLARARRAIEKHPGGTRPELGEILKAARQDFSTGLVDLIQSPEGSCYFEEFVLTRILSRELPDSVRNYRERVTLTHLFTAGGFASGMRILALAERHGSPIPEKTLDDLLVATAGSGQLDAVTYLSNRAAGRLFDRPDLAVTEQLGNRAMVAASGRPEGGTDAAVAILRLASPAAEIADRALEPLLRARIPAAAPYAQVDSAGPRGADQRRKLQRSFAAAAAAGRTDLVLRMPAGELSTEDFLYALRRALEAAPKDEAASVRMTELLLRARPEMLQRLQSTFSDLILSGATDTARHLRRRGLKPPPRDDTFFSRRLWKAESAVIEAAAEFVSLPETATAGLQVFLRDDSEPSWSKEKAILLVRSLGKTQIDSNNRAMTRRAMAHHPAAIGPLLSAGAEVPLRAAVKLVDAGDPGAAERIVGAHLSREGLIAAEPWAEMLALQNGSETAQLKVLELLRNKGAHLHPKDFARMLGDGLAPAAQVSLMKMPGAEHFDRSALKPASAEKLAAYERWNQQTGLAILGAEDLSCYGFQSRTFSAVRDWLTSEAGFSRESPRFARFNRAAVKLTCLFETPERVLNYLGKFGAESRTPLLDISNFELPTDGAWPIREWGDAVLSGGLTSVPALQKLVPTSESQGPSISAGEVLGSSEYSAAIEALLEASCENAMPGTAIGGSGPPVLGLT